MTNLTEHQFHTVWSEAVGREGYHKPLFKEILQALIDKGAINTISNILDTIPIETIESYLRKKKLEKLNKL